MKLMTDLPTDPAALMSDLEAAQRDLIQAEVALEKAQAAKNLASVNLGKARHAIRVQLDTDPRMKD